MPTDDQDSRHSGSRDSDGRESGQTFADVFDGLSLTSRRGRRRRREQNEDGRPDGGRAEPPRRGERGPRPAARSGDLIDWPESDEFAEEENASVVRAYAWTGGRTSSEYRLEIETLVSTSDHVREVARPLKDEYQSVAKLCGEPKSVAEVGAMLALPLGVVRVLLGDMARHGLIVIHHNSTAANNDQVPDLDLFQRVLDGLRRLSPSR